MKHKPLDFLGHVIAPSDIAEIEEAALSLIQSRAAYLYTHERGYTVAKAWIEAVLEYLYQRQQDSK